MANDATSLTPNQIAKRYRVGVHKVHGWIARGEMRAINVASETAKRPQWCILPEAIAEFERGRAARPTPAPRPKRRRKKNDVIEFF
jgi:transposase